VVSIIIPSRTERFLNHTIKDVLANATGEIEVFPILDGYALPLDIELIKDPRVKYIYLPNNGGMQKRQGINAAVSISGGKYIMCIDAHCMVAKGFDEVLQADCEPNWVIVPRRYKLDANNWCRKELDVEMDYEYWLWNEFKVNKFLKPYRWWDRNIARKDILIDDNLTMQASCWFMHKTWFKERGFMNVDRYTGWGQEDVEISLETWTNGGALKVNKKTWYAHLYKGKEYGRMYRPSMCQHAVSKLQSFNYWTGERKDDFYKVLKKFAPIPRWEI
jgi:glycosyltransferase involved in cell wall biosynthesis